MPKGWALGSCGGGNVSLSGLGQHLEPGTELRVKFLGFKVRACLTVVTYTCISYWLQWLHNIRPFLLLSVLSLKVGVLTCLKVLWPRAACSHSAGKEMRVVTVKAVSVGRLGFSSNIVLTLNSCVQSTEGRDFGWCWNLFIPKGLFSGKDLLNLPGWIPFDFNKLQLTSWFIKKSSTSNFLIKIPHVWDLHMQLILY